MSRNGCPHPGEGWGTFGIWKVIKKGCMPKERESFCPKSLGKETHTPEGARECLAPVAW